MTGDEKIYIQSLFFVMSQNIAQDNVGLGSSLSLNTSAPVAFVQSLQRQVNEDDIQALIQSQKHM